MLPSVFRIVARKIMHDISVANARRVAAAPQCTHTTCVLKQCFCVRIVNGTYGTRPAQQNCESVLLLVGLSLEP